MLAEDHHKSNLKNSPNHSPSRFSPVVSQVGSIATSGVRYCSPISSEERMYSENVDRLRSIELSVSTTNLLKLNQIEKINTEKSDYAFLLYSKRKSAVIPKLIRHHLSTISVLHPICIHFLPCHRTTLARGCTAGRDTWSPNQFSITTMRSILILDIIPFIQ